MTCAQEADVMGHDSSRRQADNVFWESRPNKNTEYCNVMMGWRLLFVTVDETWLSSILFREPPKGMSFSIKTSVMLLPLTTLTGK